MGLSSNTLLQRLCAGLGCPCDAVPPLISVILDLHDQQRCLNVSVLGTTTSMHVTLVAQTSVSRSHKHTPNPNRPSNISQSQSCGTIRGNALVGRQQAVEGNNNHRRSWHSNIDERRYNESGWTRTLRTLPPHGTPVPRPTAEIQLPCFTRCGGGERESSRWRLPPIFGW